MKEKDHTHISASHSLELGAR